jgi:hypothetical protein
MHIFRQKGVTMPKRAILKIMIAMMACLLASHMAAAQESQVIHFQGLLTSPDGGPLRTDTYDINFSIWDQESGGVDPVWSETQVVEVTEGLFDVFLGSVNALSPDVFTQDEGESDLRYLEIEVVGDGPMTPRTQIAKTPNSFVSSRVFGDIQTGVGSFKMMDPSDDEVNPAIEMTTTLDGSSFNINRYDPGDMISYDAISMDVDGLNSRTNFRLMDPGNDERPGFEMTADGVANFASFRMMDPGDDEKSLIEMWGGADGNASIFMFNPQPEPPAKLVEINSIPSSGGSINLNDEIGKYMGLEPSPFTPGGMLRMYDPTADAVKFEVETTGDGASMDLYDEIGKYMGLDPIPFTPGGFLYMIDPATENITISLGSHGQIWAYQATFGNNLNYGSFNLITGADHIVNSSYNFVAGYNTRVDHDDCFVWADYTVEAPLATSANNQFLVKSTGGIKFFTSGDMTSGVELLPGASSWSSISAPDVMRNVRDVAGELVLENIRQLPIKRYSYKSEDESAEHIGPVAGDFNELFGFDGGDTYISMRDESGVALAGVKALLEKIERLEARIAELEVERR